MREFQIKQEKFVWTWKGIPNNRYGPANWAKYAKTSHLLFKPFAQILNQLLQFLKSLSMTFKISFREYLTIATSANMFYTAIDYKEKNKY